MTAVFHRFSNRPEAGKQLTNALSGHAGRSNILIVPMDLWLIRKLGVPGQEELARSGK